MNVGDKVRMLRGKEEGIVTRIIDGKLIEVEIEDGFQIPVLKSDVVVVAAEETDFFQADTPQKTLTKAKEEARVSKSDHGIFLAFQPLNDKRMAAFLLNNSGYALPYALFEERQGSFTGIRSGLLADKNYDKIGEYIIQEFDRWPAFILQAIRYSTLGRQDLQPPLQKRLSLKANTFFRNKKFNAALNAEVHSFRLDVEKNAPVTAEAISEAIAANQSGAASYIPKSVPSIVDLHAEQLGAALQGLGNDEILALQLRKFEESLDAAIVSGKTEITFIHGVGNGTLRHAIHKQLSKRTDIVHFKDAQKEKFGYGATQVQLK